MDSRMQGKPSQAKPSQGTGVGVDFEKEQTQQQQQQTLHECVESSRINLPKYN
jgi:hypothetical protein